MATRNAGVAPLAKTRAAGADLDADNPEPCANATSAAVATITNTRSNTKVTAYLVNSGSTELVDGNRINIYHGIVAVWDQEASIESQSGPCAVHGDPVAYAGSMEQSDEAVLDAGYVALEIPDLADSKQRSSRTSSVTTTRTAGRMTAPRSSPHATATLSPSP